MRTIVTQTPAAQEVTPELGVLRRYLPAATRLGFAGVIIIIVWWSWPAQSKLLPATNARRPLVASAAASSTPNTGTLAILNPADLPGAQAQSTTATPADTALPSIVTLPDSATEAAALAPTTMLLTPTNAISVALALSATTGLNPFDQQPILEREPDSVGVAALTVGDSVLVPTATPTTDEPVVAVASLPQLQVLPAFGGDDDDVPTTPTALPSPTPAPLPTRAPPRLNVEPGRLWSTFTPHAVNNDHFWVARPFAPSVPNQLASPSYAFGSTGGDHYRPHHGMDIPNVMGTPVLAAVDGQVVHGGPDDKILLGPYNNFYGNSVVIRLDRQLSVAGGKLDVYVLYGHLSQVNVTVGQQVHPQDVIGLVGMTGIAIGPHLHVEMRLGANTYQHSINPYLWVQPPAGDGAVAVRLLTADGRTLPGVGLTLARFEGGVATWARLIETYHDTENLGPDPVWGENGAMDGVPAGYYVLVGVVNGESLRTDLTVRAGETSFVEIRTKQ